MNKKIYLGLFVLGLLSGLTITWLRPYTGYMDADYYYAGAKTLFEGKGFHDYYLWNYLSNPTSIPAPSHTYWMPMASLISLAGMKLLGNSSLWAARLGFVVLFAFIPPMLANLSWKTFHRRDFAILSGIYSILCGYFIKFVSEPDGFAVLFLCGILLIHMLQAYQKSPARLLVLGFGFLVGMIHLSRSDGILWLFLIGGYLLFTHHVKAWKPLLSTMVIFLGGYLVVTAGWYLHVWQSTGFPFPSGGLKTVFLTSYDELFTYPATALSISSWFQQGWSGIITPRLTALGLNSLSLLAVFGAIILVPSILIAIRGFWSARITRFLLIAGGCVFIVMTLAVPLVGIRGGLLHSGAIFMPAIWLAATSWKSDDCGKNQVFNEISSI